MQPSDDESRSVDWAARIADLAARLERAEAEQKTTAADLADALQQAHTSGLTWTQIAEAAGLASASTARSRAERSKDAEQQSPSVRWRVERGAAPRPKVDSPGLSITDAARRLSISRVTVYEWIKAGKLRTTRDESGRQRVLFDD